MTLAFLRGLEKAPTFLVPIINPPFADNSPHLFHRKPPIFLPAATDKQTDFLNEKPEERR